MPNSLNEQIQFLELYSKFGAKIIENLEDTEFEEWYNETAFIYFQEIASAVKIVLSTFPDSSIESQIRETNHLIINSVARSLMDTSVTSYYLLRDKKEKRSKLEKLIWSLHFDHQRLRMSHTFSKDFSHPFLEHIDQSRALTESSIKSNDLFKDLDDEIKNNILCGTESKTLSTNNILTTLGINQDRHWAIYKYHSQYVHSLPFTTDQAKLKSLDSEGFKHLTKTCLESISHYFALIISFYIQFDLVKYSDLSEEEPELAKKFITTELEYLRSEVDINST